MVHNKSTFKLILCAFDVRLLDGLIANGRTDRLDVRVPGRRHQVHSLWGVFASIHRVILLHAVLFLLLLLIAVVGRPSRTSRSRGFMCLDCLSLFVVVGRSHVLNCHQSRRHHDV